MAKKMLIDATHPEETRVVVMDGTKIDEFDFESINKRQLAGNIYLAKVTRVEPSLQAAFIEYGGNRHGFLAFAEIHPDYYQIPVADREALIAAEAAAQADDEDEPSEPQKAKPARASRSRSRSRRKDSGDTTTSSDDAPSDEASADNPADDAPVAENPVETSAEAPAAEVVAEAPATAPEAEQALPSSMDVIDAETPQDGALDGDFTAETGSPKSIAESAGADEDESVSEDIAEAPSSVAEQAETPAETVVSDADAADDGDATPRKARSARSPRKRAPSSRARKPAADDIADAASEKDDDGETAEKPDSVGAEKMEDEVRPRRMNHRRYKIQEVIKVRQILLVQVVKEERGNKGAALTTYLSLAGRYCVLMPNTARGGGISRKITQAGDRKKLKEIANELEVPKGMGLIIRTAGSQRTKTEIKRDYEFLLRQWEQVRDLTLKSSAPALIYEEGSLIKRSIRDLYGRDIDEIIVEGEEAYREAKDYMKMLMPSHAKNVQPHREGTPLFSKYQVESHLSAMFNPTVQLKSGGYIVIGITEALVAIDVNSGRSTREHSIEETALKTNLEASDEVARQLRLRDLAGLIVIDYIDMEDNRNNRAVEKRLKDRLQNDRARIQVGRISAFGLMEMSRQRLRPGMLEATTAPCAHCHGTGIVRSADNVALMILREVEEEAVRRAVREVKVIAPVAVANYLINQKRAHVASIEERYGIDVLLEGDATLISPDYRIDKVKGQARPPRRDHAPAAISAFDDIEDDVVEEIEEEEVEQAKPAQSRPQQQDRNQSARDDAGDGGEGGQKKGRRRGKRGGRRRGRKDGDDRSNDQNQTDNEGQDQETADAASDQTSNADAVKATNADPLGEVIDTTASDAPAEDNVVETGDETAQKPKRKRPAPRTKKAKEEAAAAEAAEAAPEVTTSEPVAEEAAPEPAAIADEPVAEVAEVAAPAEAVVADVAEAPAAEPEAPKAPEKPEKKRFGWWS